MKYPISILSLPLLLVSTVALRLPLHIPSLTTEPQTNISQSITSSNTTTTTNTTHTHTPKIYQLSAWPPLPFHPKIGSNLILKIDTYGKVASIPYRSTIILDSIDNIIYRLDSVGFPSDIIGPTSILSYNGLVRVNFGGNTEHPQEGLTRLDASEVLANVWDFTTKYGPREILLAEIEEVEGGELKGLFRMEFPGPVVA